MQSPHLNSFSFPVLKLNKTKKKKCSMQRFMTCLMEKEARLSFPSQLVLVYCVLTNQTWLLPAQPHVGQKSIFW